MMVFGVEGGRSLHVNVGWSIHSANFLWLAVPALARAGRTGVLLGLALFAAVFVQPLVPQLRESMPIVSALHPVIALLMFLLSFLVARHAQTLMRSERTAQGDVPDIAGVRSTT